MVFYKEAVMINEERIVSYWMEDITDTLQELSRWTLDRLFHRKYKLIKQYNVQIYTTYTCIQYYPPPYLPPLRVCGCYIDIFVYKDLFFPNPEQEETIPKSKSIKIL
jgi:hypothetical protein